MAGRMSSFQRKCDAILRENEWTFSRYTGNGYTMYRNTRDGRTTTVASSPKNPADAMKQVKKYAGIK